jgi:hypothetical protein
MPQGRSILIIVVSAVMAIESLTSVLMTLGRRHAWVSSGIWLLLSMGLGNPPAVGVWTTQTGLFGSRPVQKPDPLTLGWWNPATYPFTWKICQGWLDPWVPISSSRYRVSYLWSHSDMLVLIVRYWHWYITVHFDVLGTVMIKMNRPTPPTTSWNWASMEHQRLLVVYLG